jgi:hypothetical protein
VVEFFGSICVRLPLKVPSFFLRLLLVVFLAIPSVYFFLTIPPLWRDSDAFYQVATKFEFLTVLHFPPLYCFLARIPFLLACLIDGSLWRNGFSFNWPTITDLGLYFLIIFQHLFLISSLFAVCVGLAKSWVVRFVIAAWFVICLPFYAFAHCVGSEAIMPPLLLLTSLVGIQYLRTPSRQKLVVLFVLSVLCILDRHANGVVAGLVPLTIALIICWLACRPIIRNQLLGSWLGTNGRRLLVTIGLAIATIVTANSVVWIVCRINKIPYRSRAGYAFLLRFNFINDLPPERRTAIIDKAETDLHDPALTAGLEQLKEMSVKGFFVPDYINNAVMTALTAQGYRGQALHVTSDQKLNRLLTYFLHRPPPEYVQAVVNDVIAGMNLNPSVIAKDPFISTDWLIRRRAEPRFEPLKGLRSLADDSDPLGKYATRFRFWSFVPFWWLTGLVMVGSLFLGFVARDYDDLCSAGYASACAIIAAVVPIITSVVVELLPRLMLPALALLFFGVAVLLARFDRGRPDP